MSKSKEVLQSAQKPILLVGLGSVVIVLCMFDYYAASYNIAVLHWLAQYINGSIVPVISYLGFILGFITYIERTTRTTIKREGHWYINILIVATVLLEVIPFAVAGGANNPIYAFMEVQVRVAAGQTQGMMTGLYVFSSCYRCLKMRSISATLAIAAAILMFLYGVPIGPAILPGISPVGLWINNYIVSAQSRALTISAAVGSIVLSLRVLFGYEWGMYGLQKPKGRR